MATLRINRRCNIEPEGKTAGKPGWEMAQRRAKESRSTTSLIVISIFSLIIIAGSMYLISQDIQPIGNEAVYLIDPPERAPRLPVPAFTEDAQALQGIQDDTFGQMRTLADGPRDYLIHKSRFLNVGAERMQEGEFNPVFIDDLSLDRSTYRGEILHLNGELDTYWTETLPEGHRSGLKQVYMALIKMDELRSFYAVLEDDPAPDEFLQGERVDVYGFYLQHYYDDALQKDGPILISRRLLRQPPRPFVEPEEDLLANVKDDSEDFSIKYIDGPAMYYLIHKAWATSQEELNSQVDKSVTLLHMFNASEKCRGKVVRISGTILKAFARKRLRPDNPTGIGYVWEGQVVASNGMQDVILTLNFLERPSIVDNCRVEFVGYYLQKWAYRADNDSNQMPITVILIGKAPIFHPPGGSTQANTETNHD